MTHSGAVLWTGRASRGYLSAMTHAAETAAEVPADTAVESPKPTPEADAPADRNPIKILTSCPSCLQGLSRYENDLNNGLLEADYIVVEMARRILGEDWLPAYVEQANAGGIERVLV